MESMQRYTAQEFIAHHLIPDTAIPLTIGGIFDVSIALKVQTRLSNFYDSATPILFMDSGKNAIKISLGDLAKQKSYSRHTAIELGGWADFSKNRYGYADLIRIMLRLLAPDGCPWDRAQTHESIAKNALEEAEELVAAIAASDTQNILEESGDVVLQGVFHGMIAERDGTFGVHDVIDTLCKKLVSRHSHVFGTDKAATPEDALGFWQAAKKREKNS